MTDRVALGYPFINIAKVVRFTCGNMSTLTANATTTFGFGGLGDASEIAGHLGYILDLFMGCFSPPADADGNITLSYYKFDASANAEIQIVNSFNLKTLPAQHCVRLPMVPGLTIDQLTLDRGDYMYARITATSTGIDVQMVGANISCFVGMVQ